MCLSLYRSLIYHPCETLSTDLGLYSVDYNLLLYLLMLKSPDIWLSGGPLNLLPISFWCVTIFWALTYFLVKMFLTNFVSFLPEPWNRPFLQGAGFLLGVMVLRNLDQRSRYSHFSWHKRALVLGPFNWQELGTYTRIRCTIYINTLEIWRPYRPAISNPTLQNSCLSNFIFVSLFLILMIEVFKENNRVDVLFSLYHLRRMMLIYY